MSGHKHAELMLEYAKDASTNKSPWELWEYKTHDDNIWVSSESHPSWKETNEYRRKPVKWSPVGGDFYIRVNGDVGESPSVSTTREFGHERPTKEQAERAAVEMRRFNRLLALRDELCGDDGNWLAGRNNYWVYYDYEEDNYGFCSNSIMQTIGLVYFTSEQTVKRACDMLNSGEVEL